MHSDEYNTQFIRNSQNTSNNNSNNNRVGQLSLNGSNNSLLVHNSIDNSGLLNSNNNNSDKINDNNDEDHISNNNNSAKMNNDLVNSNGKRVMLDAQDNVLIGNTNSPSSVSSNCSNGIFSNQSSTSVTCGATNSSLNNAYSPPASNGSISSVKSSRSENERQSPSPIALKLNKADMPIMSPTISRSPSIERSKSQSSTFLTKSEKEYKHARRGEVIPQRKRRDFIPDELKDEHYWERRRKNNLAAKRSREKRRLNDIVLETKVLELTNETNVLKLKLDLLMKKHLVTDEEMDKLFEENRHLLVITESLDLSELTNDSNVRDLCNSEMNDTMNNKDVELIESNEEIKISNSSSAFSSKSSYCSANENNSSGEEIVKKSSSSSSNIDLYRNSSNQSPPTKKKSISSISSIDNNQKLQRNESFENEQQSKQRQNNNNNSSMCLDQVSECPVDNVKNLINNTLMKSQYPLLYNQLCKNIENSTNISKKSNFFNEESINNNNNNNNKLNIAAIGNSLLLGLNKNQSTSFNSSNLSKLIDHHSMNSSPGAASSVFYNNNNKQNENTNNGSNISNNSLLTSHSSQQQAYSLPYSNNLTINSDNHSQRQKNSMNETNERLLQHASSSSLGNIGKYKDVTPQQVINSIINKYFQNEFMKTSRKSSLNSQINDIINNNNNNNNQESMVENNSSVDNELFNHQIEKYKNLINKTNSNNHQLMTKYNLIDNENSNNNNHQNGGNGHNISNRSRKRHIQGSSLNLIEKHSSSNYEKELVSSNSSSDVSNDESTNNNNNNNNYLNATISKMPQGTQKLLQKKFAEAAAAAAAASFQNSQSAELLFNGYSCQVDPSVMENSSTNGKLQKINSPNSFFTNNLSIQQQNSYETIDLSNECISKSLSTANLNSAAPILFQELFSVNNSIQQQQQQQQLKANGIKYCNPSAITASQTAHNMNNSGDNMPLKLRFKMLQLKTGEVS